MGRAMYCRAGGRGFDSVGRWRAITHGRKITKEEGISFALQTARYLGGSDDHALYKWRSRLPWVTAPQSPQLVFRAEYLHNPSDSGRAGKRKAPPILHNHCLGFLLQRL